MTNEFEDRLGKMQETWLGQKEGGFSDNRVPPGLYRVQLQLVEIGESQSSGRLQIHREHVITEGELMGEVLHDYMQLETDNGPRFVAQWIQQMGFDVPDDPRKLPDVVAAIMDAAPILTVRVKHSGDFQNVYVQKLLEYGAGAQAATQSAASTPPPKAPPAPKREPAITDQLRAFAQEYGIDPGNDPKAALSNFDWRQAPGLTEEQISLLGKAGLIESTNPEPEPEPEPEGFNAGGRVTAEFDDGDVYAGTIRKVNNAAKIATVVFDDGDEIVMDFSALSVEEPIENDAAAQVESNDEEVLGELVAFCQAHGIELQETDTVESIKDYISEYEWHRDRLTPQEQELLDNLGRAIKWAAPEKPKLTPKCTPKPAAPKAASKPAPGKKAR